MHLDTQQLAAYLDGALSDAERADLRAHVLTCATCAARLERLRADGRRITVALSSGAAPDVRAAVRGAAARLDWRAPGWRVGWRWRGRWPRCCCSPCLPARARAERPAVAPIGW